VRVLYKTNIYHLIDFTCIPNIGCANTLCEYHLYYIINNNKIYYVGIRYRRVYNMTACYEIGNQALLVVIIQAI
jgi:hypothetical protein